MIKGFGYLEYNGGFGNHLFLRADSTNKVNIALLIRPTP